MINWDLYKGKNTRKSKEVYKDFVKSLSKEGYSLIGEYINTKTKVDISCPKGHIFKTLQTSFKIGNRCPMCNKKSPVVAKEDFFNSLKENNLLALGEYKGANTPIKIRCVNGHEYTVKPSSFKSGSRKCKYCNDKNHIAKIKTLKYLSDNNYSLIGDYVDTTTKITLKCKNNHIFTISPNNLLRGGSCLKCKRDKFINRIIKEVASFGYELVGDYKDFKTKITLKCNNGHLWDVKFHEFKRGSRCPMCSRNPSNNEARKLIWEDFFKIVEDEGYKVFEYEDLGKYKTMHDKVSFRCPSNHWYNATPSAFKQGKRCPHCNINSHGEVLAKKILDEYSCKYESQKKFDGLVGLNGGQLSYDFFVDNYLLIEIQGGQHFKPTTFGGRSKLESIEAFKQQQEHDRLKREFAKENGYELLEIPYFGTKDLDKLEKILREKLSKKYLIAS